MASFPLPRRRFSGYLQVLGLSGFLEGLRDAFDGVVGQYRSNRQQTAAVDQRIQCGQRAFSVFVGFGKLI